MNLDHKPTLYIVDDEPDQLLLLRRAAERCGEFGETRTTVNSHLAYQELLESTEGGQPPPALVITDWKMPSLTGAELACALRAHPVLKHVPVIALSSSYQDADQVDALACGCKAFFRKPACFSQLTALLREISLTYCQNHVIA